MTGNCTVYFVDKVGGLSQIDGTDQARSQSCRLNFPACGWSLPFLMWIWLFCAPDMLNHTYALHFSAPLSNQSFILSFTRVQMDSHGLTSHLLLLDSVARQKHPSLRLKSQCLSCSLTE